MKLQKYLATIFFSSLFISLNLYAKNIMEYKNIIPMMPGFEVKDSEQKEFDQFKDTGIKCLPIKSKNNSCDFSLGINASSVFQVEGKVTKIFYRKSPGDATVSGLQVYKNFENYFQQIGAKRIDEGNYIFSIFLLEKNDGKTWYKLYANDNDYNFTVIQNIKMEQVVTATELFDQINKQGFVNLNVNFDTNKSLIKEGDKGAINEVVTLLKNDSKLKLSVEGHTDNVGAAAANKSLSQARSDSLVAYMVSAGIPASRLVAKGFGSEVPVADNRTEEGKAKNRRVELVKIK